MSILIFCILPSAISYIYSLLYCRLRGVSREDQRRKTEYLKIVLCVCFSYLLMIMTEKITEISCILHLLLLEVLSGIDIHVRRIPTELLAASWILSAVIAFHTHQSFLPLLSAVLIGIILCYFRRRVGIGLYDILLIVILSMTLRSLMVQLKFIAVILMLWGVSGLIIAALKKGKDLSIPLVPLITFSYYAVQTFL